MKKKKIRKGSIIKLIQFYDDENEVPALTRANNNSFKYEWLPTGTLALVVDCHSLQNIDIVINSKSYNVFIQDCEFIC